MLKLYENIRRLRIEAGMSQAELARRAGYTDRSSIAKIEKGQVDLSQTKIAQFASIFCVAPGELMGWEQEPEDLADIVAGVLLDPDTLQMVELYQSLSTADKAMIRGLVASLAEKKADAKASARTVE